MQQRGYAKEAQAKRYLELQGLSVVAQNYRAKCGELDLVCIDQATLVFVEVRYRRSSQYGGALASITYGKQKKLWRTAQFFLQRHREYRQHRCRFDVIVFQQGGPPHWIRGAFRVQ